MFEFIVELGILLLLLSLIYILFASNKLFSTIIFGISCISLFYGWYLIPVPAFLIAAVISGVLAIIVKPEVNNNNIMQALKNVNKHSVNRKTIQVQ
ncbi:MAG: hypothetical protein DKM50_02285 [Candidatus Margulisiibacteriota bacterium]|nr:MAG: hypothetical protein A2X43_06740 [Candidatus Margulisbacteria bacterium GWD2_39_127]OGI05284.1 MAG: hypothetical protein A2X42_03745 [Candidatus Margulisbacteria bacterium GWF2_38_17]OGI10857.1 MAG: hypothetical protein A2X41_05730 [Candidatus Margulisbacteria bacterium GWE2_39_32]PZM83544.1 MAG: hypothetical protein DKM50_02285 [Candidatus Margulisiibacteriota bacterium]HAR64278.1 hypothetical protein [Candidatus Margulisiibacteriota bacterium]